MEKNEIIPWDWHRILFGNAPPQFLLEVFIRTVVIFLFTLLVLRLLGKRMDGQLALSELAVMILLGALVSPAMQIPERGVAVGVVALTCLLLLNRLINGASVKNEKLERLVQGKISILVKDGVLQLPTMNESGISRQNLFSALREKGHYNLSEVKRVYFEACGMMNVYPAQGKRPGLSLYPDEGESSRNLPLDYSADVFVCRNCGNVERLEPHKACPVCKAEDWTKAIESA
jgi:uncharacterized membrane protein YcaP (DUF421 family)